MKGEYFPKLSSRSEAKTMELISRKYYSFNLLKSWTNGTNHLNSIHTNPALVVGVCDINTWCFLLDLRNSKCKRICNIMRNILSSSSSTFFVPVHTKRICKLFLIPAKEHSFVCRSFPYVVNLSLNDYIRGIRTTNILGISSIKFCDLMNTWRNTKNNEYAMQFERWHIVQSPQNAQSTSVSATCS